MKKIGVYPGSFDPFTNGHLYLVEQAVQLFDEVVILVAANVNKKRRIPAEVMVDLINQTLRDQGIENARAIICQGTVVRKARELAAKFLIRGLRDGVDYRYEENLAEINYHLEKMETVYFRAGDKSYVSSSMVMELWSLGEEVTDLVPAPIDQYLRQIN